MDIESEHIKTVNKTKISTLMFLCFHQYLHRDNINLQTLSIKFAKEEYTGFELVYSGDSLTSWGEGASLALVGQPSSDSATIKMFYIDQFHTSSFPIGLVKTESGFIVRSVETGLGR